MDEGREIQIQVKKTPAFTVLKNGSILKNIFLLRKPPLFSTEQSAADTSSLNQEPNEEILLVGRHPNCNITLEHPSISRYHLRIHTNPSSLKLAVVDLSSVHGTWVSGKRIQPGVSVKLKEGDTVKMGGSSRVYELHWVPLSQAFDVDDPFVPATFKIQEETQDESSSYLEALDTNSSDDEEIEMVNHGTTKEEPIFVIKCSNSCCDDTETEIFETLKSEDQSSCFMYNESNECEQLNDGTIKDVPISLPNFSESSIDDEIFTTVSIQSPLASSETEIFNNLNQSEDLSFDAIKTPEKDAINQEMERDKEVNMGSEFGQMGGTIMRDVSNSMVLCTSILSRKDVDMGVKCESVNLEIMKNESVFLNLLDETDMNQEQTFGSEISRGKEGKGTLFDSLDRKELEFYTPDKENKDPNAFSKKSLRRRWKEDEYKESNKRRMLKEDVSFTVNEGRKDIFDMSFFGEVLFSSEQDSESRSVKMGESGNSINCHETVQKVIDSTNGGAKKKWIMVLDTSTLLHSKSLEHLKLLQGLKGTQLFIPKIVLKELMDMKDQQDIFNITTKKVSLALQWLNECTITTKWWIHMDDDIKTEDKVLETALHLCKEIKDSKIIILSNDVSLKIKSMAEGIICEESEEFFRSLVNPFSERFMWIGSLARGLTWSCLVDDFVLREKYEGFGFNVSNRLKGLKLLARLKAF